MRTNPYPEHDPKDYSMLTTPKLSIGSKVVLWDEDEGGEWVQARVVDATFNRGKKCWEYSAVVEFVDEEEHTEHSEVHKEGINIHLCLCEHKYKTQKIVIKDWYCFSDEDLKTLWTTGMYIVIKK